MSKKDRQSMEELWSKRFDEEIETNGEGPLSRKAKREREKSISPILTVTLIFLALLIILPTSAYIWWSSRDSLAEEPSSPSVEQVAENNQDKETENDEITSHEVNKEETEKEDQADAETEENVNEGSTDKGNEQPATSDSTVEEDTEPAAGETSEAEPSEDVQESVESEDSVNTSAPENAPAESEEEGALSESSSYYTVKAGDNMYRIALNHGMTTEELMRLNGLQDETVYVGQELQVN